MDGYPNSWMIWEWKIPSKMDDLRVPPFQETPYIGGEIGGYSMLCSYEATQIHHPHSKTCLAILLFVGLY